jgi:signal peptidase II
VTAARRWSTVGLTVLGVLLVDQLSKWWIVREVRGEPPIDLVWTLRLNYAENTGMAFSRGPGAGRFIAILVIVIVVVLVAFARRMTSPLQLVLVGVVIGGALGNLLDRIFRAHGGALLSGAVVDFIDVQWWPIFNVADIGVSCGAVLFALSSLAVAGRDRS